MPYPPFKTRHVGDNVVSSRTLKDNGCCEFNIFHQKLEKLIEMDAAQIFDIYVQGERHLYYIHAQLLMQKLRSHNLFSVRDGMIYQLAVDPKSGSVYRPNYSMCRCSINTRLFHLFPMEDRIYHNIYTIL